MLRALAPRFWHLHRLAASLGERTQALGKGPRPVSNASKRAAAALALVPRGFKIAMRVASDKAMMAMLYQDFPARILASFLLVRAKAKP